MATLEELEAMSEDELREAANANMEAELAEEGQPEEGQPEGVEEQEVEEQPEAPAKPTTPTVYRREIDLGDGSGKQVFEGATQEELIDKLATAQANATKWIREHQRAEKVTRQETEDNEYVLSQELLAKPTDAFKKLFERVTGMPIDSFKGTLEKVKAFEAGQSKRNAAVEFVKSTPEYHDVEANGRKIGRFLNANNMEWSVENMKKAFEELSADGLLVPRPQEPSAGSGEGTGAPRIAAPAAAAAAPVRKAGSNLSARGRSVAPPVKKKLSEADLYSMDEEQLRSLANRQLSGQLEE